VQRDGAFRKPAFSHGINGTCLISEQDSAGSLGLVPPVTRPEPPLSGDERAMVTVWLDYQRATLQWKCDGLEGRLLVHQGVPPSTLSLLGLVRHMTIVEWFWFEHIFGGGDSPKPISTDHDPDADFNDLSAERAGADLDLFRRRCDVSRGIVAAAPGLDALAASSGRGEVSLRWIMIHMIEEYARHNGHADFLRELIDGAVGE
jgi:hypothetical protein